MAVNELPDLDLVQVNDDASIAVVGSRSLSTRDVNAALERRRQSLYVRRLKALIDGLLATVTLLILLPVMLLIALAVRISLGKGVLFRQQRVGRDGKPFTVLKFRTMVHDRRQAAAPIDFADRRKTHKHAHDPRLTGTGRFLRTWSLDELPQLVNVVKGDMSLVGPRPELESIVAGYEPWQHARHVVKPGLTGLWQTEARGKVAMQDCVQLDIDYASSVSLALDVKILARTPFALVGAHRGQ
jgi:lipopolysaccharide/colanic/teichoic acid biosynthesis glycosyltransferase